jgi:hypothetical protein
MARTSVLARSLTAPEESRQCVDEHGATPAPEQEPGSNTHAGLIRFDFPGHIGEQSLEAIGWEEWFEKFKESNLAPLVQDETATSQKRTSSPTSRTGRKATKKASTGGSAQARREPAHSTRSVQPRRKAA